MIAAARSIGIPARYVNGYMHNNSHSSEYQSTHAWAEFHIANLGWVGFDPSHHTCVDQKYVRFSCGYDFSYTSMIHCRKNQSLMYSKLCYQTDFCN